MTEQAERYKSQGNTALQAKMYGDAVELYTKAIGLNPNCEIYFSNRSAAYAAMERFREALDDAQACTPNTHTDCCVAELSSLHVP
jgi:tetratricopeptide (TPR) repeat protein